MMQDKITQQVTECDFPIKSSQVGWIIGVNWKLSFRLFFIFFPSAFYICCQPLFIVQYVSVKIVKVFSDRTGPSSQSFFAFQPGIWCLLCTPFEMLKNVGCKSFHHPPNRNDRQCKLSAAVQHNSDSLCV